MELEEILQKEKRNEEYIFFIKRMGIGMLTSILPFIVILFWGCSMWIG